MPSPNTTIVSRCTIYPDQKSTTIETLKLSVSDLPMLSCQYIQKGVLLPYPPYSIDDLITFLKHSLSTALSHFPALAGRLQTDPTGHIHIVCNDAGVDFIQAKARHLSIHTILSPTDVPECFKGFFAFDKTISYSGHAKPLMAVQVTELQDGIFIGCSVNHAVTDGTSFWHFFNTFAEICKGSKKISNSPDFSRNTLFNSPAVLKFPAGGPKVTFSGDEPLRERVFHFRREAILKLKFRANNNDLICNSAEIFGKQRNDSWKAANGESNGKVAPLFLMKDKTAEISSFQSLCAQLWRSVTRAPVILFLHGFPELWYSWRHQLLHLSSLGYRCVAPDLRGYGDTDAPESASQYTGLHVVGDLIGLLDAFGIDQVFLVGHDWGAMIAWYLCLLRPDRVRALVNLNVAFMARHPKTINPMEVLKSIYGEDYYACRFQEPGPGEIEKDFAQVGTAKMLRIFFSSFGPKPLIVPKETGFRGIPDPPCLPPGFSEEDINFYANKFNQKGFTGALNYYRAINQTWDLMAPWIGVKIQVPVKFIIGDQDINYHLPGLKEYILNGGFKKDVPRLEEVVVMGGVAHFPNQARPEEVSEHIYSFFKKLQVSNNNPRANSATSSLNGNRVSDLAHLHAL